MCYIVLSGEQERVLSAVCENLKYTCSKFRFKFVSSCLMMILLVFLARDDRTLLGRVQHHIQASQARSTWYWCHPLLQIYPTQVICDTGLVNKEKNTKNTHLSCIFYICVFI